MKVLRPAFLLRGSLLLCVAVLSACTTSGHAPKLKVRTNVDPEAKFDTYRSYGFVAQPGTNDDGKTTPLTIYFMQAVRQEMDSRGYRYTEESPDLLVNFHTNGRVNDAQTQRLADLRLLDRLLRLSRGPVRPAGGHGRRIRKPSRTEWAPEMSMSSTQAEKCWSGKVSLKGASPRK